MLEEAYKVLLGYFVAWGEGDVEGLHGWTKADPDAVRAVMTPELAEQTGDDPFTDSYEQVDLAVLSYDTVSDEQWNFTVLETFKDDDGTKLEARYNLSVLEIEDGWRITDWEALQGEDAPMTWTGRNRTLARRHRAHPRP